MKDVTHHIIYVALSLLTLILPAEAQAVAANDSLCPIRKIDVVRLPDLNMARTGHQVLCIGSELTVLGGHTTGFVPTATAEYLKDDKWHTVEMTYPHDDGMSVQLPSGKVLTAGGHSESMGIGQTWGAELYDPVTHTFGDYGCLSQKRTMASGAVTDSGRVVISGNWYGKDGIELYDGKSSFTYAKPVTVQRSTPYILRTANDDVLIFGSQSPYGHTLRDSTAIVDRLRGEPFSVPLLKQWLPINYIIPPVRPLTGFIGDEARGEYAYLLLAIKGVCNGHSPSEHSTKQKAILMVRDTVFSVLPTVCPIPKETNIGGSIHWYGSPIADRKAQKAYIAGIDHEKRLYLLCVEYTKRPAPLTLCYTDPLPLCGFDMPVLTAGGNLAIVGGNYKEGFHSTNYEPTATAWLIRLNDADEAIATATFPWIWVLIGLTIVAATVVLVANRHRRKPAAPETEVATPVPSRKETGDEPALFARIHDLMVCRQLFRNPDLKPADLAAALSTNARYVTDAIKAARGQTFTQYVNDCRIAYAQQLFRLHPDKKIMEVAFDAGFSSERSFFRIFKTATGMTTQEWLQNHADSVG